MRCGSHVRSAADRNAGFDAGCRAFCGFLHLDAHNLQKRFLSDALVIGTSALGLATQNVRAQRPEPVAVGQDAGAARMASNAVKSQSDSGEQPLAKHSTPVALNRRLGHVIAAAECQRSIVDVLFERIDAAASSSPHVSSGWRLRSRYAISLSVYVLTAATSCFS